MIQPHAPERGVNLSAHGKQGVQLKLEHQLGTKSRPWFKTRVLLFYPTSLAMTEERLGKHRWYTNLKSYIRLQPHQSTLASVAAESLYHDVQTAEAAGALSGSGRAKKLRRLFRLHTQRFREAVRHEASELLVHIERGERHDLSAAVDEFIVRLEQAREPLRAAVEALRSEKKKSKRRRLIRRCDEWASLTSSLYILRLVRALEHHERGAPTRAAPLLDREEQHRRAYGYPSTELDLPTDSGELSMYMSSLKKSIGAAIYLDLSTEAPSSRIQDFTFAIAASIAMLWAVGAQLATWWFVGNPTQPDAAPSTVLIFVVTATLAYALKDRIKERLRGWFRARIPTWLYDRRQVGRDDGDVMVTAQESTSFLTLDELDERDQRWFQGYQRFNLQADVIAYERKTTLEAESLRSGRPNIAGIAEIVRFAARPWRTHMNNLEHEIIYREPSGAVRSQVTTRTYPIIALLEVDQPGYNNRSAYRVLVSRDGIEEIKRLDEPG